MTRTRLLIAFALGALAWGCSKAPEKPAAPAPRVENNTVIFDPASPQLAGLRTAEVARRGETRLHFNGRVVWDEDRTARVFTPFAGKVLSIAVRPGDHVKQGQALAVIAAPELGSAQSDARKAEQDFAVAEKTLARVRELHDAGVAPAKDLQAAQADEARASAERTRTAERLRSYGIARDKVDQRLVLRSPVSGVVVDRQLNPGQEIRPDASPPGGLFVVSDPAHLWFMLDVEEASLAAVRPGLKVALSATALGQDSMEGVLTNVADVVDPQTRTVKVRGVVDNAERRLKAEMFVTAALRLPARDGLLVPTDAVFLRGEQHYVFVDAGGGRFARKAVVIGPVDDGHQVIRSGLSAGEKVVVEGNLLLEKLLAEKD